MVFAYLSYFLKSVDFNKQYFLLLQSSSPLGKPKNKNKKEKEYARFKGTKIGGFISIIASTVAMFLTFNYVRAMNTADNDTVNSKKIIVDFDNNQTEKHYLEKQWSKLPLLPSFDLEFLGSDNDVCKFDIFHDEMKMVNGTCKKQEEFTPMKINPEKLKQYVVLYIDMTDEDLTVQ